MATREPIHQSIEQAAISRVLDHLHREREKGIAIIPLVELSEATAIDPATAEAVMRRLEQTGPFDVEPIEYGEISWRVEGCVYDVGGWDYTDWDLDYLLRGSDRTDPRFMHSNIFGEIKW